MSAPGTFETSHDVRRLVAQAGHWQCRSVLLPHRAVPGTSQKLALTDRFKPISPSDADNPFIPGDETILSTPRNDLETITTYAPQPKAGIGAGG